MDHAVPARQDRLFSLMLDYLRQLPEAKKFCTAFEDLSEVETRPVSLEDAPRAFMEKSPWMDLGSERSRPLIREIVNQMSELPWHTTYDGDPAAGPGFSERAMATGRIGPKAPVRSDDFASGQFAVGPDVEYYDHAHEPEELYLPIAGTADYWNEAAGWRTAGPDTVMVHPQWQWHAMRTREIPVLILWAWIGPDGFGVTPVLRPAMAGLPIGGTVE